MIEGSTGGYTKGKKIFRDYVLKGFLGEGSYGMVYLVENRIGLPFALKVLHKNVNMERRGLESVMRIRSNRLVSVQDCGKTVNGVIGILMEYVPVSLENVLKKGNVGEIKTRRYFEEILKGLKVLVDNGVLHRDIKPGNLFVLEDIIKIGDFGTVRFISGETSSMSEVAGTFHYMAPERFKKEYGFSVDRWSAVVIFYLMLTGRYPFDGKDRTEIFGAIMMEEPNFDILPEQYRPFFRKCFQKDFQKRHKSLQEMIKELDSIPLGADSLKVQVLEKDFYDEKTVLHLRRTPHTVPNEQFKEFFKLTPKRRPEKYVENNYVDNGNGTVTDFATGLMWQKSGSLTYVAYDKIKEYTEETNREMFAGFADWRLPTVDELMSLLEPAKSSTDLYIDPMFDKTQSWCWTSDVRCHGTVWIVYFRYGHVNWNVIKFISFIRLVRS